MSPEASDALEAAWSREPAELLASHAGAEVYLADWRALRDLVAGRGGCDALIVDAPYSEATHSGHNGGDRNDGSGLDRGDQSYGHRQKTRAINYAAWDAGDVDRFVDAWSPLTRGWMVSITDHILAPAWKTAMERAGRYAFAPLPIVEIGSRVRLTGDGPSSWTCWIVGSLIVSRPSSAEWLNAWREARRARDEPCALPGAYVYKGHGDREVMGGKRLDCMSRILEDYSHPGDLIVDPCCGAGTTLIAAQCTGRRAIGGDSMREHAEHAANRVGKPSQQSLFGGRF